MWKRGQSTAFVIVGILVIAVAILLTWVKQSGVESGFETDIAARTTFPPHIQAVRSVIDSCLDEAINEGVIILGLQGGYYQQQKATLPTEIASFSYWAKDGVQVNPSLERMQTEMSRLLQDKMALCVNPNKFTARVTLETPAVVTTIQDSQMNVQLNYPVSITKDGSASQIKEPYNKVINIQLGKMRALGVKVMRGALLDVNNIDLSLLLDSGFHVEVTPLGDDVVYAIKDKTNTMGGLPYQLIFVVN